MKRYIAVFLTLCLLLSGCAQEQEEWQKGGGTSETAGATGSDFDSASIDTQLQGQWMYYDSALGAYDTLEFRKGTVIYTSWLESVPEKVTVSEATYTVDDSGIDLYFPKTDFHNRFDYTWIGSELVLSRYIDSGVDKGNTRIYQKKDTPVPSASAPAQTSTVTSGEPVVGEWTAAGIISKGSVVSFESNAALADLYDTNWASFDAGGSYSIQNGVFSYSGTWIPLESEDIDHLYMLSQTSHSRFTMQGEDLEEVVTESEKTLFSAFLDDACDVLLIYETLDEEETPLIYVRDGKGGSLSALMNGSSASQKQNTPSAQSSRNTQHTPTSGEKNALESAKNYLRFMAFSYTGLIDQLEYEGYSYSEAKYAVDNCGADWYEQAVKCALEYMSFSRSGLIEQLEYEGFTHDQAVYGVEQVY